MMRRKDLSYEAEANVIAYEQLLSLQASLLIDLYPGRGGKLLGKLSLCKRCMMYLPS